MSVCDIIADIGLLQMYGFWRICSLICADIILGSDQYGISGADADDDIREQENSDIQYSSQSIIEYQLNVVITLL